MQINVFYKIYVKKECVENFFAWRSEEEGESNGKALSRNNNKKYETSEPLKNSQIHRETQERVRRLLRQEDLIPAVGEDRCPVHSE